MDRSTKQRNLLLTTSSSRITLSTGFQPKSRRRSTLQKIFELLKSEGKFCFTTVREDLPGYLYDVTASQYGNSYEKFLSAMGISYRSLFDWETLLKQVGFEMVYACEEVRQCFFPTDEALLTWWETSCLGFFDAAQAIEKRDENERLLRKYGWKRNEPVPTNSVYIDVVVKKP